MPPGLLAITPPRGPVDAGLVQASVDANVPVTILLRTPGADPSSVLADEGRLGELRSRAVDAGLPVVLSCDAVQIEQTAALARERGLAGLQLRGDPSADDLLRARAAWPDVLLGASVHGEPKALPCPADYLVFAPVFAPNTPAAFAKPAAGLDALTRWSAHGHVLALGGITVDNAASCLSAGARGLAGISTFLGTPGAVAETLRALAATLARACNVPPST